MSDKTEATPKKKGKMGKLIVIGGGVVVLLAGGVGGGLYAANSGLIGGGGHEKEETGPRLVPKSEQKHPPAGEGHEGGESVAPATGPGGDKYASNYYAMEKDFTANLQNSTHFVQLGVAVSTPYDDSVIAGIKTNDIAIRSAILLALGDTTEDEVFTGAGKKRLQARLVKAINDTLLQKEGFGGVSNVYFTSFVVQ
jgi:flagellar FliL protein